MQDVWVLVLCQWIVGLAFAVSAAGKAVAMSSFRAALSDFALLPEGAVAPVSVAITVAEAVAVGLVAAGGVFTVAGFSLALALLLVFSTALALALRRKANVSCNCFGASDRRISSYDLARNGVLALGCVGGLWGAQLTSSWQPGVVVVALLGLMAGALVAVTLNLGDIIEVLRKPSLVE